MADDWSERMFPHMGGAGEKEMRATSEREERDTEEIIRTRERATVDLHVFLPVPAYIISICNLVKHSYLNN